MSPLSISKNAEMAVALDPMAHTAKRHRFGTGIEHFQGRMDPRLNDPVVFPPGCWRFLLHSNLAGLRGNAAPSA